MAAIEAAKTDFTLGAVEKKLRQKGWQVNVQPLFQQLLAAGLTLGSDGQPSRPDSALERSMVRIFSLPLHGLEPLFAALDGRAAWLGAIWFMSAAISLGWSVAQHATAFETWSGPGWLEGVLLLGLSFAMHECAHAAIAASFGLRPRCIEGGFYLGFLPTFYLRIGGLYRLPPRQRVAVWIAGSAINILTGLLCNVTAQSFPAMSWLSHLAFLNFSIGVFNLVPLLPTDGYFILSTLVGQTNLRSRGWEALRRWRPGSAGTSDWALTYGVGAALGAAWLLGSRFWTLWRDFAANPVRAALQAAAIIVLLFFAWWRAHRLSLGAKSCE